jgi:hypothetical protein
MCHVDCQQAEEDEDEDMRSADEEQGSWMVSNEELQV